MDSIATDLKLHFMQPELSIAPILPSLAPPFLFITCFAEIIDFTTLGNTPYVKLAPDFWSSKLSRKQRSLIGGTKFYNDGKKSRLLLKVQAVDHRKLLLKSWIDESEAGNDTRSRRIKEIVGEYKPGSYLPYYDSYGHLMGLVTVTPQMSIFLIPAQSVEVLNSIIRIESFSPFSVLYDQIIGWNSLVYIMKYDDNRAGDSAFSGGSLICVVCGTGAFSYELAAARYRSFDCIGTGSCWSDMTLALKAESANGDNVVVSGDWDINGELAKDCTSLSKFKQQRRLNEFWQFGDQVAFTLFLTPNATSLVEGGECKKVLRFRDDTSRFARSGVDFKLRFPGTLEDSVVYVTEHDVTLNDKAVDLYLRVWTMEIWILVVLAPLVSGSLLGLIWSYEKENLGWRQWAKKFGTSLKIIGRYLLDQHYEVSRRHREASDVILGVWLIGVLFLTNQYKGALKSTFSLKFPYSTDLKSFQDISEGYSIFVFNDSAECSCANTVRPHNFTVFVDWVRAEGRDDGGYKCDYLNQIFRNEPTRRAFTSRNFFQWMSDEMGTCRSPKKSLWSPLCDVVGGYSQYHQLYMRTDFICPKCLTEYIGEAYSTRVKYWHQVAQNDVDDWGVDIIRLTSSTCDYTRHTTAETATIAFADIDKVYWMTRKRRAVFAITTAQFPWYWNLFKKAMKKNPKLKFAHTGSSEIRKFKKSKLFERNDASFYFSFPAYQHLDLANGIVGRIQAFGESGLLNFIHKWSQILRPPRKEPLNKEVDEANSEVQGLNLENPSMKVLFVGVAGGLGVTMLFFCGEVMVMRLQNRPQRRLWAL